MATSAADSRPIAIVTGLRDELRPILARATDLKAESREGLRAWRGRLGAASVALACTGDGNRNAERWAGVLLESFRPTALIGFGVAGGLTPDLALGEIVFGERLFDSSGERPFSSSSGLARAIALEGATPAVLLTVDRIVCAPDLRRRLAAGLPARGPAAVDLESAFWARAASSRHVSFLALRAISDVADESLPALLAECQEAGGPVRRSRVARRALLRPSDARRLLELRRRVRSASERLASVLESLLAHLEVR